MHKKVKKQSMYVVATSNNIYSDIDLSCPFQSFAKASAYLREQYNELFKNLFGDRGITELDHAECSDDSYSIFYWKGNDNYYGHVKKISVPVPYTDAVNLAKANLMAPDAANRCRLLSETIQFALYEKGVDLDITGKEVLNAIQANDIDGLLSALTGSDAKELLELARLCRVEETPAKPYKPSESYGYILGFKNKLEYTVEATIDIRNLCVKSIHVDNRDVYGAELCSFLDEFDECKVYLLQNADAFDLVRQDDVPGGFENITYWYGKEDFTDGNTPTR